MFGQASLTTRATIIFYYNNIKVVQHKLDILEFNFHNKSFFSSKVCLERSKTNIEFVLKFNIKMYTLVLIVYRKLRHLNINCESFIKSF